VTRSTIDDMYLRLLLGSGADTGRQVQTGVLTQVHVTAHVTVDLTGPSIRKAPRSIRVNF